MLTVRNEQLEVLSAELQRGQRNAVVTGLKREFPEYFADLSGDAMQTWVSDGFKAAEVLGLHDSRHLLRFLRLRCLPPSVWLRPAADEMMVRVLTDTSVDAERRLQFVESGIARIKVRHE